MLINIIVSLSVILLIFWVIFLNPLFQFSIRAIAAIKVYESFYRYLFDEYEKSETTQNTIFNGVNISNIAVFVFKFGKYIIEVNQPYDKEDLISQVQAILKDAISYGNRLTKLQYTNNSTKNYFSELEIMCNSIKILQWKNGLKIT